MTITVKDKTGRPIAWTVFVKDGRWRAQYDGDDGTVEINRETLAMLDDAIREATRK